MKLVWSAYSPTCSEQRWKVGRFVYHRANTTMLIFIAELSARMASPPTVSPIALLSSRFAFRVVKDLLAQYGLQSFESRRIHNGLVATHEGYCDGSRS